MKLCFDIETDGLEATKIWILCIKDVVNGKEFAFSDYDGQLPPLSDGIDLLKDADLLIGHNVIGYDIPVIDRLVGSELHKSPVHDTWVMSQCLQYRRGHKHGLAGWGIQLGSHKIDFDDWSKYSEDMYAYCTQDVSLNVQVYHKLLKEYSRIYQENPLIMKGLQIEHKVAQMNQIIKQQGWNFDIDRAKFVEAKFNERMFQIEKKIEPLLGKRKIFIDKEPKTPKFKKDGTYNAVTCRILSDYFGRTVNPVDTHLLPAGRTFQRTRTEDVTLGQLDLVKEWMLKEGWKPDDYTRKKLPTGQWVNISPKLTETSLEKWKPYGPLLSEYYTLRNRLSVVEGWLKKVKDGRLHGNMWTIGTPSFRARHEVIVNLPAVSASYGKDLRELFRADDGEVIVGCDSAGNQLRGLCHFVGNAEFTDEVINGDQHQRNADALGCTRPLAKNYLYAYLFGAGDAKLGQVLTGKSNKAIGAKSREDFAKGIQGLQGLRDRIEGEWTHNEATQGIGWFKGLDGRPVFCESSHQALNYLLQSTESITCKAACAFALDKIQEEGLRANPRIWYHDEMAFTCHPDDATRLGEILHEAYREAPKWFGVTCMDGGDYVIGQSYADVH